jgi:signal transduction histidine kinase
MYKLFGFPVTTSPPPLPEVGERVHPEDRAISRLSTELAYSGHEHSPMSFRVCLPDGSERRLLFHARVRRDEHGNPIRLARMAVDVTDLLDLEQRLAEARRLESVGTLTAGIAHDFNNLLTVIGGSIELAQMGQTERLETALQGVRRATAVIRQLLEYSRSARGTDGDAPGQVALVDLRSIVGDAVEAASAAAREPESAVPVTAELPSSPVLMTADPGRIDRIVTNLLLNARDAVLERARHAGDDFAPAVHVRLRTTSDTLGNTWAQLCVIDNGVGMSPEVQQRAFEPFYTTKPKGHGTGLGLATVYGAVTQLGGEINMRSAPGQGTTVEIRLPARDRLGGAGRGGAARRGAARGTCVAGR